MARIKFYPQFAYEETELRVVTAVDAKSNEPIIAVLTPSSPNKKLGVPVVEIFITYQELEELYEEIAELLEKKVRKTGEKKTSK